MASRLDDQTNAVSAPIVLVFRNGPPLRLATQLEGPLIISQRQHELLIIGGEKLEVFDVLTGKRLLSTDSVHFAFWENEEGAYEYRRSDPERGIELFRGGMIPPKVDFKKLHENIYTREAIAAQIEGIVQLKCRVYRNGNITKCRALKPLRHLTEAVIPSARVNEGFTRPALGQADWRRIRLHFSIQNADEQAARCRAPARLSC